jgi:hypothetical protein
LPFTVFKSAHALAREKAARLTDNGRRRLGQLTLRRKKFYTESVENPVEKIAENRIALQQSEEISRLHYRGAIDDHVNSGFASKDKTDGLYCNHLMNIVIADGLPASAIELLQQPDWNIDNRQGRPAAELTADLKNADALVVRSATKVTRDMIDAAPKLRVIARAGTGVDNVDVPAATARGIVVMNAPGANSLSVAELAMGLILSMARNIPAADASMKTAKWEKAKFAGAEIRSKTLGLVGLGRIGQEVASRAQAY